MRSKVLGVVVAVACAAGVHAQTARSSPSWVGASGGQIPETAVAYGREADGRDQFVCRGAYGGGTHIGKIASGFGGCNIGYGGKEVTLDDYEVFVGMPRTRSSAAADLLSAAAATYAEGRNERRARAQEPPHAPPAASSTVPAAGAPTRHFDDEGQPYIEETLPDGTIKQTYEGGYWLVQADGTRKYKGFSKQHSHAQIPTPPELPDDPKRGRIWLEEHNTELLDLIRSLVNNDDSEMRKFTAAEQKATSDGLFQQIAHRTDVAKVLAQKQ